MFVPCRDHCYLRYGRQYTKECDVNCDYAKAVKESNLKDKIIDSLLDVLEAGHIGMRAEVAKAIKEQFGVEY